jgi:cobyrinic acid a,c-diamide synthase
MVEPGPLGLPRLVVAAPASGHGKTTLVTGLIAALVGRGLSVSGHKVGPDYIDPGYHALAAGRLGRNLDPYLCGEHRVAGLLRHGAAGADVAVVEGVMGLFDGASARPHGPRPQVDGGRTGYASTAHVARLIGAPVLLVVDASAQGASVAALVHGFTSYDPQVRVGGVVLNRIGSERHEALCRDALGRLGIPVLGALRRDARVSAPSRHLGLVPAAERDAEARAGVAALGERVAAGIDLDAVLALARRAGPLTAVPWRAGTEIAAVGGPVSGAPRVAVAAGEAFTFSYAETPELLRAAGAEVVPFDPLRDPALPAGTRGVVLGGGFPQVHAGRLGANAVLRAQLADFVADGGAVAAECAGMLYLAESLDAERMCGVIPARAAMGPRLTLGYRQAHAPADSVLAPAGARVRGHEFHRTTVTPAAGAQPAWRWPGTTGPGATVADGFAGPRLHASYLHVHWAGHPELARRFVAACA